MSADFVRYSPEIETFDPKLSEYMTQIIDFWEKKVANSPVTEGSGRAVRGAHAKTLGVVRAEVELTGNAPAPRTPWAPTWRSDRSSASLSRSSTSAGPSWSRTSRTRPRSTWC